jgi:hypothetical protein
VAENFDQHSTAEPAFRPSGGFAFCRLKIKQILCFLQDFRRRGEKLSHSRMERSPDSCTLAAKLSSDIPFTKFV